MSVKAMTAVFEHSQATMGTRLVLLALADRANDDGYCWPGVADLAQKARMSERNVQLCLRRLVDLGEIEIEYGTGRKHTNHYRILLPGLTKGAESSPFPKAERVKGSAERVKASTEKGEADFTRTVREPSKNHHTVLTQTLAQVCYGWTGESSSQLTRTEWQRCAQAGKELGEIGATPEQVRGWKYNNDAYQAKRPASSSYLVTPQTIVKLWRQFAPVPVVAAEPAPDDLSTDEFFALLGAVD